MKVKPQTHDQISFVFGQSLAYPYGATLSFSCIPKGFDILDMSADRGGSAKLKSITFSTFGNPDQVVLGVRVDCGNILKEDIRVYDRKSNDVTIYPKGEYQDVNPRYRDTHHIPPDAS